MGQFNDRECHKYQDNHVEGVNSSANLLISLFCRVRFVFFSEICNYLSNQNSGLSP